MNYKWLLGGVLVLLPLLIIAGLVIWLMVSRDPLTHPLAAKLPWPIACSTRGCITSTQWLAHTSARTTFAVATKQELPTSAQTLTTLARQHLADHALVRSPVTTADARRYREEILNATNEAAVKAATGLSLNDYDKHVIVPFLQQEALRQQLRVESATELYQNLARQRFISVLPLALTWQTEGAIVAGTSLYKPKSN